MPTLIVCAGIFLPNGEFSPNTGDGHAKNARRICDNYPDLCELANKTYENADDFLLQCGCAIVAGYNGVSCLKVAKNNSFPAILEIKQMYKDAGFEIWPYWEINPDYIPVISKICKLSNE